MRPLTEPGRSGWACAGTASVVALSLLAGCQEPLGGARGYSLGNGGAGSAAVLQTEGVEVALAGAEMSQFPEYGRRDYTLSPASNQPMLATNDWPSPDAPSLDNPRYIYINQNSSTMMFFRPNSTGSSPYMSYWRWYGW